jgi:hypothetical protein
MSEIDPAYLRAAQACALGLPSALDHLPKEPDPKPSNVYSFEAGRSWRAIRQMRKRGWL